ncbi:MAG: hypothetical protein IKN49_00730 [Elusimicrobiaceae bacterium]|nr:hypothetical protein [Elusimicrobiaceae bacterium]
MRKVFRNETDIVEFFANPSLSLMELENYSFEVEQWPDLTVKDPNRDMVMEYSFIQSLTALQEEIYHSYALLKYHNRTKKLTEVEKQSLHIQVKVKAGCTEFVVNGAEIAKELIQNLTGTQVMLCVISFILCYFSSSAYSQYLKNKTELKEKDLESDKYKAAIETLGKANELNAEICKRSIEVKKEIIKPLAINKQVQIGTSLFTQEELEDVLKKSRSSFDQTRLDDFYTIEKVEQIEDSGFKCTLGNNNYSFSAILPNSLFNDDKLPIIQNSLFKRTPIFCVINAKVCDNRLKDAELLDVAYSKVPYNKPNLIQVEDIEEES